MNQPIPAAWPNREPRFPFGQQVEHIDAAAYQPGLGMVVGYEDDDHARVRWSADPHVDTDVVGVDELVAVHTDTLFPHGWAQLVALGPLPSHLNAVCQTCPNPAVVIDLSGPRCADHPPQPGQWGATLNWAPPGTARPCAPNRCYCGRRCIASAPNQWADELAVRRIRKAS